MEGEGTGKGSIAADPTGVGTVVTVGPVDTEDRGDTELASEPHAAASELIAITSKVEHIFITLRR